MVATQQDGKKTSTQTESMGRDELLALVAELKGQVDKLDELFQIVSRGKYMWESTFDAITQPVQIVDSDFNIERANLSIAAISDGKISDYPGKKCYQVFAGREEPCEACPLLESLEKNGVVKSELLNSIHGHEMEVSAYPYLGKKENGVAQSAILSYRDVTEERRLQQEVVQQEKMAAIGILAGGVAHEINNPLGGILAFTQLLLRSTEEGPILSDLKEIESAALRCKGIVADLLDFSRIEGEQNSRTVNLGDLLHKVVPFVRGEIKSYNIELKVEVEENVPEVLGKADRLQQIFLNLMTNACHAMPEGGVLTVRVNKNNLGQPEVRVIDTGSGIA